VPLAASLALLGFTPRADGHGLAAPALAQVATASPSPRPDDCALITREEAGRILGFAVIPPDESSRRIGHCLFPTSELSRDGSVLYTIYRSAQIPQIHSFYSALLRTCAGVAPGAPREKLCQSIAKIANATDIDGYFAARIDVSDAVSVPELGDRSFALSDAVVVRRDDYVLEVAVDRSQELQVKPSVALAQILIERLQPQPQLH
jgi:hypothetical protein